MVLAAERTVSLALVHHANQYIITNGYQNREGLDDLVGTLESSNGYLRILELHKAYQIPLNLHLSGTLLEAILWHRPDFLEALQELGRQGLLEMIGSSYGQNIMRFFRYEHNLRQLTEELDLYRDNLKIDPREVKVFWPPERVWDREELAPALTDPRLPNGGYKYVLLDDRLLYPVGQGPLSRDAFDRTQERRLETFGPYRILHGQGLVALPIASALRKNIPPRDSQCIHELEELLRWLSLRAPQAGRDPIAIYADDLEKTAGIGGWGELGPAQYQAMLAWISQNPWVRAVKLSDWTLAERGPATRRIEAGTFAEMSHEFGAGEGYENWYFDSKWDVYRAYYSWAEARVKELTALGADGSLIELAWKQLLASSWETAWHTPPCGVHGNPSSHGEPSPWSKALASHSRHAAVIAEAAYWMRHKDDEAHAYTYDIDNDGQDELVLKNDKLFAVVSPACGGRLVYLFSVDGDDGNMVIGNPCDDWNWMEELNQYMDSPRNHPGALADVGCEHDRYTATFFPSNGQAVHAALQNTEAGSAGYGLVKEIVLSHGQSALQVNYTLPDDLPSLEVEFGLSPDYLSLLRSGRCLLQKHRVAGARGWSAGGITAWVKPEQADRLAWAKPYREEFGHGCSLRLASSKKHFTIWIGVHRT